MKKTILKISGMMCGMCEAHINDAIRAAFPVRKVTSSHTRGETVILSEASLDTEKLKQTVNTAGYILAAVSEESVEKKGLFSGLFKR